MRYVKKGWLLSTLLLMAFSLPQNKKIKIYLIGDSTMSNKSVKAYPEAGWGMPFAYFFDSLAVVDNRAQNGRSTRTFIEEKRWQSVSDNLKEGDYVLIQFGHNDEIPTKRSYTTEQQFKDNLGRFINETKSKKANPVLITPVARRKFNASGALEDTHSVYSNLVRQVAAQYNVPLIDLDKRSQELLISFGPEDSRLLFNHLEPGEHPNYPDGKVDDTHFNELGARKVAQLVLAEIKAQNIGLVNYIVKK